MREKETVINNAQDLLELMVSLPSDRLVFFTENFSESFFDLRTGLASEILQKVTSSSKRLGIVGDYSRYSRRSLNQLVVDSNPGNQIVFVDSLDEALQRLSA